MAVFVFVLTSSCGLCWLSSRKAGRCPPDRDHSVSPPGVVAPYVLVVLIILFFASTRAVTVGTDLSGYRNLFYSDSPAELSYLEPGYRLFQRIVHSFTDNFRIMTAVCSILTLAPMLFVLYKKVDSYLWLGMLVFVAEAYASSFNIIRAALAYSFLYMAYFLRARRFYFYLPFMILAVLFHYTSILLVLVFLMLDRKLSFFWYLFAAVATMFLASLEPVVMKTIPALLPRYSTFFYDSERFQSYVPALNFLLFGVLSALCWIYRDKLLARDPQNALLINITIVGLCTTVGLYWFSMTIRFAQMARFFMPFLIPQIVKCEDNKLYRRLLIGGFTGLYLVLFFIFITGKNGVLPYRFFWQE